MKQYFDRNPDGTFNDAQCCHCGEYSCDCDNLPDRVCEVCGETFLGKHYFSWAVHQAVCKVDREMERRK